ncbi:hypothetical protein GGF50DRAFT_51527 [Schizophyllum commune]
MYPAYYHQWPNAWRRNPHIHYASDVRPEGKYTTKLPFNQLNYNGTEQAQHDPSTPNPLYTPRHTRQMLPVRPALRHLAPPPVLLRRPVPLPPQTPAPPAYAYATPHVHQRAPTASAPQQAAPHPAQPLASNPHNVPLANPLPAAPPARPVLGRMPIWSRSRNRWEGDFAYEAQAPSVPAPSSAPPAGAQTAVPPAATQTTRPPPPTHQQPAQSVQYQAPTSAQPDSRSISCAPQAAAPLPSGARAPAHLPSTSADSPQGTFAVARASESNHLLQRAVDDQSRHGGGPVLRLSGLVSTGENSRPDAGQVVVNDRASFKHRDGIYTLAVVAPWEAARSLTVTAPITLNDIHIILRRAPNLETAQFACITPDTAIKRHWDTVHANNLKSFAISDVQASIGGVFNALRAQNVQAMHVAYSPGMAQQIWQDEQGYYTFLQEVVQHTHHGVVSIVSNDAWYRDLRAENLRMMLESATNSTDWRISVQ